MPEAPTLPEAVTTPAAPPSADTRPVTTPIPSPEPPPTPAATAASETTTLPAADTTVNSTVDSDASVESREVLGSARQRQEINIVSNAVLLRKMNGVRDALEKHGPSALDTSEKKNLQMLRLIDSGVSQPISLDSGNPMKLVMVEDADGNRQILAKVSDDMEGEEVTALSINSSEGEMFHLTVKDASGTRPVEISRAELAKAHVLTEKEAITASMTQAEKDVVDLYVKGITTPEGEDPLAGMDAEKVNSTIKAGAREIGMFTVDDVQAFVDNIGGLSTDEKKAIVGATEGNLLDFESFDQAMRKSGLSPDTIATKITKFEDDIERSLELMSRLGPNDPNRKVLQDKIDGLREEIRMHTEMKKLYAGSMEHFFTKMQNGEFSADTAKGFIDAFRSGEITPEAFEKFEKEFPGLKRLPGESDKEWKERMKKRMGIAGLLMLMIVVAAAQATPALGPEQRPQH